MNFSFIVPVDLAIRPFDILFKIQRLLKFYDEKIELVFGHNDRNSVFDKFFKKLILRRKNTRLASKNFYSELVNQGLLRNEAVKICSNENICLLDADCLIDEKSIDFCLEKLKNEAFIILPCLYLSRRGARRFLKFGREVLFEDFINFKREFFLHLAMPSAIIFMKKNDFLALNGFDENFFGRGGEDFDFMLRLAFLHKKIPPKNELLINKFYKAPLLCEGFRRALAGLSLPYFFEKNIAFHLPHPRNKRQKYFQRYNQNSQLLNEKIKILLSKNQDFQSENEISLLKTYENLCDKFNLNYEKYAVLFSAELKSLFEKMFLFLKRL